MAEFVKVIENKKRMCKSYTRCEDCRLDPLYKNFMSCEEVLSEYPQEAEEIILKWAEEHPFKTNADVIEEFLLEKFGINVIESNLNFNKCSYIRCKDSDCDNCKYANFWEEEYKGNK